MNYPGYDPMYTDPYAPRLPPHMEARGHSSYGFTGDYRDDERHPVFTPPPPGLQRALSAGGRSLISSPPKRAPPPPKVVSKKKAPAQPSPPPPSTLTSAAATRLRWVAPDEDKKEESSPLDLLAAVRRARRASATADADDYEALVTPRGSSARRHKNSATSGGGGRGGGANDRSGSYGYGRNAGSARRNGSPSKLGAGKGNSRSSSPGPSYGGGRLKPSVEQALIMLEAQETEERAYLMNDELYCFGDVLSLFQYALELEVIREAAFELFDFEKSSRATVYAQEKRERQILSYWMQENYDDVALGERLRDVQTRQGTLSPFRGSPSHSYDRRFMSPGGGGSASYDRYGSAEDNFNDRYWAIRRSNSAASWSSPSQDPRRFVVSSGKSADPRAAYAPANKYAPRSAAGAPTAPLVDDSVFLDALQLRDHLGARVPVTPPPESAYGFLPQKESKGSAKKKGSRHTTPSPSDKKANAVAAKKKKTKTKVEDVPVRESKKKEKRPYRSAPARPDDQDYDNDDDDNNNNNNNRNWQVEEELYARAAAPASSTIRRSPRDTTIRSSYSPVPEDPSSSLREASIAALHDRFVALLSTPV